MESKNDFSRDIVYNLHSLRVKIGFSLIDK